MKQLILIFIMTCISVMGGTTTYSGKIGGSSVTMAVKAYSDGYVIGTYLYDRWDTPIKISGRVEKGMLELKEKDIVNEKKIIGRIVIDDFDEGYDEINGRWISEKTGKSYDLFLRKGLQYEEYDETEFHGAEVIQWESTRDNYFTSVLKKEIGEDAKVIGIKIYEKQSDKLLQELMVECQNLGVTGVSVGDYNFDGVEDFSVFESSYAGPNTSSLYYLKKGEKYVDSGYEGVSLMFDNKTKRIQSVNSSRGGASVYVNEYELVEDKMILRKETKREWDESKGEFVETVEEY